MCIQAFWKSIWNVNIDTNTNAPSINELKNKLMCQREPKDYDINLERLKKALSKIETNKSVSGAKNYNFTDHAWCLYFKKH